jgi:uncharacterized protein (UPF0335 family)
MDNSPINTAAATSVTGAELRQFIEQVEQVRAELADLKEREKEIFAEAKARGYMTRPIRTIIKERAQNPDDLAEAAAVLELYRSALGIA